MSPTTKATKPVKKSSRRHLSANWFFLTSHALVLLAIARRPELRMRDIAQQVGITERAVQRIVADLIESGYVSRVRTGRRNQYQLHPDRSLKHSLLADKTLGHLIALVQDASSGKTKPAESATPTSGTRKTGR